MNLACSGLEVASLSRIRREVDSDDVVKMVKRHLFKTGKFYEYT